jgi:ElaA protein
LPFDEHARLDLPAETVRAGGPAGSAPRGRDGLCDARRVVALHSRSGPELSPAELYGLLRLRAEIFVVEQTCPYQDLDGLDLHAQTVHLWLAEDNGRIVSSVRLLPPRGGRRKIGRVVTAADRRRQGLGAQLMQAGMALDPALTWELHAQCVVQDFYRGLGFTPVGEVFDEDGIPHIAMVRAP